MYQDKFNSRELSARVSKDSGTNTHSVKTVLDKNNNKQNSKSQGDISTASAENAFSPNQPRSHIDKLANPRELYIAIGLVLMFFSLLIVGRIYWDERYYIPEEGLGYAFGLIGGIMMLFALGYSLFKKIPRIRKIIKLKTWLQIHILFGIAGPFLVYLHSTFHIGSLNGGVALVSMSLVLLSGILGRYLYSKTHYGLGGQKARLTELHNLLNSESNQLHSTRLNNFTQSVMSHSNSLLQTFWELISYNFRSRWVFRKVIREISEKLSEIAHKQNWDKKTFKKQRRIFKKQLKHYLLLLHKVSLFKLYERFFLFWLRAHVPLLYLLVLSGVIHVFAVHLY